MMQFKWKHIPLMVLIISALGCTISRKQTDENKQAAIKALREPPTRGVWLTNVASDALKSREQLEAAVELCQQYGINTIFMVVWNKGYTLFPSKVMEKEFGRRMDPVYGARDPLQELINLAKPHGIKVFAWLEYGFASSYGEPADGGPLLRQKPHWAARDASGKILTKNGFQWMNALHPEVQEFMVALAKEVVSRYDIAGIQGDDRLPALPSEGGYDSLTVAMYQAEFGANPPADSKNPAWVHWRAQKLNDFGKRLYLEVKAVNPGIIVSMAPSIFPWSKEEYLQDWPSWVKGGYADMICPQIYRYDIAAYRHELRKIVRRQLTATERQRLFPGILLQVGSYTASPALLEQMVQENRRKGIRGEVFFFMEGIRVRNAFFSRYKNL